MLTADYLDALPESYLKLYRSFEDSIIQDMARRIAKMDMSSATAWQFQRLNEAGSLEDFMYEELAKLTGQSEAVLRHKMEAAGVETLKFDDAIYEAAGKHPLPLSASPAMQQILTAGWQKTNGAMRNLTLTTVLDIQNVFIDAVDKAYLQVATGTLDYNTAIKRTIKQIARDGLSVVNFASGRRDHIDVAARRAILTGVSQTAAQLQMNRADDMGCDLVQTSAHGGARPSHQLWQGKVFSRSGTHAKYPNFVQSTGYGTGPGLCGWNCVVGETLVSGPAIRAGYRRKYSGEIIVIGTAGGHELTVTANHPILTDNGWIAAGLLVEGDNVISRSNFDRPGSICPNVYQDESSIQDVFDSLSVGGNVFRFSVSPGDFHGDVSDGEVDVVFPDGFLRDGVNSAPLQEQKEFFFGGAIELTDTLNAERALNEIFIGALGTPDGIMSGLCQFGAAIDSGSLHPFADGIGATIGNWNTNFGEICPNQAFGDSDLLCDFVFPKTGVIQGKEFVGSNTGFSPQINFPISRFDYPVSLKAILDCVQRATVLVSDKLHGLASEIETNNIVFVQRKFFTGHVYNLHTVGEWYFANNIITHNCRHSYYPFFEGISENAYSKADLNSLSSQKTTYNGSEMSLYDATQEQRSIERDIRYWKRQANALLAGGQDNTAERLKVRFYQARMRDFIRQTKLSRQNVREQVWA